MSDELAIIEGNSLSIARTPQIVLDEAREAARALKGVIDAKKRKVIISGKTYLEFEDWQTVGRFYGIAPQIVSTKPMEFGDVHGWEAIAHAVHVPTGRVVASAESMCMSDEPRWGQRPMFQLRSMAQTRAAAKALRNALAWVVVLAGYAPTPAEEMPDEMKRDGVLPAQDDFTAPSSRGGAISNADDTSNVKPTQTPSASGVGGLVEPRGRDAVRAPVSPGPTIPSDPAGPDEADRHWYIRTMTEKGKADKLTPAEKRALMEAAFGSINADVGTVPIEKLHALYIGWSDVVAQVRKA